MIRFIIVFVLLAFANVLVGQSSKNDSVLVYDRFDDMEHIFQNDNDTTYLINFWATWCKPCVAELPYIDSLSTTFKDEKLKVILVSLDFKKQIRSKLMPFIKNNNVQSEVVVLADGKANSWIDRVDPNWSGAIPITIVYNGDERFFYEEQFHSQEEVINIVKNLINKK